MTLGTSIAARHGPVAMAAHQICMQVWLAVSLLTDALAASGQVLNHPLRKLVYFSLIILSFLIFSPLWYNFLNFFQSSKNTMLSCNETSGANIILGALFEPLGKIFSLLDFEAFLHFKVIDSFKLGLYFVTVFLFVYAFLLILLYYYL